MSDGWGCCATGTGGKVIWFSRRARAIERAPLVPIRPAPSLRTARPMPRKAPVPALAGSAPTRLLTAAADVGVRDPEGSPSATVPGTSL